jgi:ubiquinone/menaquinone biosynthesis C-methylase UbiE
VDISATALGFNPKGSNVAGSAVALPCKNCSFDVVIASQMTHHFTDDRVIQLFREASRVASRLVLVSDLHRNLLLYSTLWLLLLLRSYPASFRSDALLSVCRGWRVEELRKLAMESGLRNAQVRLSFGARVILAFRKT